MLDRMLDKTKGNSKSEVTAISTKIGVAVVKGNVAGSKQHQKAKYVAPEGATTTSAMIEVGDGVGNSVGVRSGVPKGAEWSPSSTGRTCAKW